MGEESVWSRLGVGSPPPTDVMQELRNLIHQMQIEMLTSIEGLSRRLAFLEGAVSAWGEQMQILQTEKAEKSDNVYDFISRAELGIEEDAPEEYLTEPDTDEVKYIETGFAAPPPNELSTAEEFAAQNKIADMMDEEFPEILEDEFGEIVFETVVSPNNEAEELLLAGPDSWATNIVDDIRANGGSINQYWSRFGLIPKEIPKTEKTTMLASLKQLMITEGISKYNVNRMRHFYYFGTPEEGAEKYDAFIN